MKRTAWAVAGMVGCLVSVATASEIRIPEDFPTIQEGVDHAHSGDVVQVAAGEYLESIIVTRNDIALQGGFDPVTWERSPSENRTHVDGLDNWNTILLQGVSSVEVSGFYLSNAKQLLRCEASVDVMLSENCLFDSTPQWNGYTVGIWIGDGSTRVRADHNQIYDIVSACNSEGFWIYDVDTVYIVNNTFYNIGSDGLICQYATRVTVRNNIFSEVRKIGVQALRYSSVDGGYNCFHGVRNDYVGVSAGVGNVHADPRLVDPWMGDFHLCSDSPCIDSGDPGLRDPDGTRLDMGALFFHQGPGGVFVELTADGDLAHLGQPFGFDIVVGNDSEQPADEEVWLDLYLPTGAMYAQSPFHAPWRVFLGPGFVLRDRFEYVVPMDTPLGGPYRAVLRAGGFPDDVIAESAVEFAVTLPGGESEF
jgi:hypothetical protein